MNDKGVYRTAPATPGLLNTFPHFLLFLPFLPFLLLFRIEFARGMLANKEDWNKLVMAAKMVSDPNIQDVLKFVSEWCGLGGSAPSYSFK